MLLLISAYALLTRAAYPELDSPSQGEGIVDEAEMQDSSPEAPSAAQATESTERFCGHVCYVQDDRGVGIIRCHLPHGQFEDVNFCQDDTNGCCLVVGEHATFQLKTGAEGHRRRALHIQCPRRIGHITSWWERWGLIAFTVGPGRLQHLYLHERDAPFAAFFLKGDEVTFVVKEAEHGHLRRAVEVMGGRSRLFNNVKAVIADGVVHRERHIMSRLISMHHGDVLQYAGASANLLVGGEPTAEMHGCMSSGQVYAQIREYCASYKKLHCRERSGPHACRQHLQEHVRFKIKEKEEPVKKKKKRKPIEPPDVDASRPTREHPPQSEETAGLAAGAPCPPPSPAPVLTTFRMTKKA